LLPNGGADFGAAALRATTPHNYKKWPFSRYTTPVFCRIDRYFKYALDSEEATRRFDEKGQKPVALPFSASR